MEAVIFIGLPGSGKSSFYKDRFFHSHVRISLDLLRTRHRERRLMDVCLATQQRFVVDNTNPSKQERASYIELAKANRFQVVAFYFQSKIADCLQRNSLRPEAQRVADVAIYSISQKLELPSKDEGFDARFYVRLEEAGFVEQVWCDEL